MAATVPEIMDTGSISLNCPFICAQFYFILFFLYLLELPVASLLWVIA
jgi:hypothetical protein